MDPLRTSKRENFEKFARVIDLMDQGRHLTRPGLAEMAETMNHRKPSEVLRILRDHTPTISPSRVEMKIWSGPCGDAGRPAETTGPPIEECRLNGFSSNRSSEIPCRVSSDLHEWRNDFPTVSTTDPAKLKYE